MTPRPPAIIWNHRAALREQKADANCVFQKLGVTPNSELQPSSDTVLEENQNSLEANEGLVFRILACNKRCH